VTHPVLLALKIPRGLRRFWSSGQLRQFVGVDASCGEQCGNDDAACVGEVVTVCMRHFADQVMRAQQQQLAGDGRSLASGFDADASVNSSRRRSRLRKPLMLNSPRPMASISAASAVACGFIGRTPRRLRVVERQSLAAVRRARWCCRPRPVPAGSDRSQFSGGTPCSRLVAAVRLR
jgi:hypothetical protein